MVRHLRATPQACATPHCWSQRFASAAGSAHCTVQAKRLLARVGPTWWLPFAAPRRCTAVAFVAFAGWFVHHAACLAPSLVFAVA